MHFHFGCICIQNKLHPKIVKRDLAQILDAGILDAVKEFFISNGQWSVTSGFYKKKTVLPSDWMLALQKRIQNDLFKCPESETKT